jgi:hypothetical protein
MLPIQLHSKEHRNGKPIIFKIPRMSELLEKANPGIVIALCGNKVDLEERQVTTEVTQ